MSPAILAEAVCAVCGRKTPPNKIVTVEPDTIDFSLLCNAQLPESVLPTSYDRAAYEGAILHPKGLLEPRQRRSLRICKECRGPLSEGKMPKFALANWLYYGYERLPEDVRQAFRVATHVEKLLISRARGSRISYKFSELPGHYLEGTDRRTS